MGAIQGIFAAQYDTLRAHGHTLRRLQRNGRGADPVAHAVGGRERHGLDVRQLLDHGTTRCVGLVETFRDATKPVFEELYGEVAAGNEAQRSIDLNSKPDYREKTQRRAARDARKRDVADRRRGAQTPPGEQLIPREALQIFQIVSRSGGSYPPPPAPL